MDRVRRDPKKHPVARSVACYFCNEFCEDKYLQDHIIQCSAVLEPCPKKCGVYIQRSAKEKHVMECRFKNLRPRSTHGEISPILVNQPITPVSSVPINVDYLESEIMTLKSALGKEKQHRQEAQIEIKNLQKIHKKSEEYINHLNSALESLRRTCFEDLEKRKSNNAQSQLEIDKVHLQYQVLDGWKKQIDASIEYVKNRLIENDNKLLDSEFTVNNHEKRLLIIDRLEMEINMLHQKVNDEQFNRQEETISWRGELNEFKDFFAQENAMIGALWTEQRDEIENLKKAIEVQANSINDFKIKYQSIIFDTKSVTQIATESSDRLDSQNNELKNIRQSLEQLKQDFKIVEESVINNSVVSSIHNGSLLWRIDDFKAKMDSAKDHNTVLHSPIFNSSLNGYKLRLEIYLNGIKKWRGRHVIVSLQVLKGDWDPLLIWPCNIEAKVLLRDQSGHQGKSLVKYITAKRLVGNEENEDPQESSSQYIFITHTNLEKQNFVKDNLMFLEIIILNDHLTNKKCTEVITTTL